VKKIAVSVALTLFVSFSSFSSDAVSTAQSAKTKDGLTPLVILQDGPIPPSCNPLIQTCPKGL
jgi:hypothetical protein